eukprot:CAMPEP_0119112402 /NCGR_PEP_ID=MMETSP1180-20130426/40098_1 /TAXON_ID=3052 ORGANISM="Chlamydomonas cf sp, Strain CCMP681" /NCGR_SAMPLE_ID=MMETSP1180 /ASSEMBLY_ACC=CAM_ASM_000741 /LENGTH=61 /DNA_ID=CAMNT_0007099889 /DNA_START=62 /DNA_END=247 /DNA_ORIENTATION=+
MDGRNQRGRGPQGERPKGDEVAWCAAIQVHPLVVHSGWTGEKTRVFEAGLAVTDQGCDFGG